MSHVGSCRCHIKGIAGIGGHLCPVFRPIYKSVACGRASRNGTALVIGVVTPTAHRTTVGGIRRHSYHIAGGLEMRHVGSCRCHAKGIAGIGGNLCPVPRPIDKCVTRSWSRCNGAALSVVVVSAATHRATVGRRR